jgi:hypothetical protein
LYGYIPNKGKGGWAILLGTTTLKGLTWTGLAGEADAVTVPGSLDGCGKEDNLIIILLIEFTPSFLPTSNSTLHSIKSKGGKEG